MTILLDNRKVQVPSAAAKEAESTVGTTLNWVRSTLPAGRVLVKVELDGETLEGPALAKAGRRALGKEGEHTLKLVTADQKELSLTTLGKLAALIQWMTPQHKDVAGMLERGETPKALERLNGLLSAWQQIQQAYSNLAKMLGITLAELKVNDLNGEATMEEFYRQLGEVQTALQNHDFVMLADILQYEMDGAAANWMALLESTLGVVEAGDEKAKK